MAVKPKELVELWDEVCRGNQRAYARMHRELYPRLLIRIKRFTMDEEIANSILQDIFIQLWLKKESIGRIDNVEGYFHMAMRYSCINHLKKSNTLKVKTEPIILMELQNLTENSIEFSITAREANILQKKTIDRALNKLSARQREIIQLRFYENLNCTEIVKVTGIQYQSVINTMYRALQTLRHLYPTPAKLRVE